MNLLEEGKRKVTVTLGTMGVIWATATVMVVAGKMDAAQWSQLMQWMAPWGAGIFTVGNAVERLAGAITARKTSEPSA